MLLTEESSRKNWCPFGRVPYRMISSEHVIPVNRLLDGTSLASIGEGPTQGHWACNCIASACMAWRWGEEERELSYACDGRLVDDGPKGAARRGYCGLAGIVQFD